MDKKIKDFIEKNGNILKTCKECSDKKYYDFIMNKGLEALMNAYSSSKQLYIKSRFTDGDAVEHMWVNVLEIVEVKDNIFIQGVLDNQPIYVKNVQYQKVVNIKLTDICNFISDGVPFTELV